MKKHKKTISRFVAGILLLTMCVQSTIAFAKNMPENMPVYSREDDLLGISPNIPDMNLVPSHMARSEEESPALYKDTPVTLFRAEHLSPQTKTDLDYTDWWYSPWEDCHYLFLPATADRSNVIITYETDNGAVLYLNDTAVTSGNMTSLLGETDEFRVTIDGTDCGILKIMQSNLGCIYLSTSHGSLDALDMNRGITEKGSILMLNAKGNTEYSGEMEHLKAHGNSSWDYSQKKPYNLKLPKKVDLYGMGKAKKWVLLGNYLDHSMFRNAATFEMSRAAGMDTVMDYVFVDLYADGSYRGTYQLTERVQIQKNRVNIRDLEEETEMLNDRDLDEYTQIVSGAEYPWEYIENSYKYYDIPNNPTDITGGYLLQFQLWNRYGGKVQSGFITSRGQTIDISEPEYASEAQVTYIRNFVQELEDAIYSETGYNAKGKHYSDYIDVDSLVRAYLIQEISMNPDGTNTSFYLWKDSDLLGDGKIHFGPAWDFDLSYGTFATVRKNSDGDWGHTCNTNSLLTAYFPIDGYDEDLTDEFGSNRPTCGIGWVGQLYKRDEFLQRVAEIYFADFDLYLQELTVYDDDNDALLTKMAAEIQPSANMNNARWHMYGGSKYCVFGGQSGENFMGSVDMLRAFITRRRSFLSELWYPLVDQMGDVNKDGSFDVTDIITMQKYLLGTEELKNWQSGDFCKDGQIDIFDLALMKRKLMES